MVATTKVQLLDRDLIVRLTGTDAERSAIFADFARQKLAEGEQQNEDILGSVPPHLTFVDGVLGASEDSVKPNGVILYEFEIVSDALTWIADQLRTHSPVGSGRDPHPGLYQQSHLIFADGTQVPDGAVVPVAAEYVFLNNLPYARKIEAGESPQAPDGVYEAVASMAASKFNNVATIQFSWRAAAGGQILSGRGRHATTERALRQPAIIVTPRQ